MQKGIESGKRPTKGFQVYGISLILQWDGWYNKQSSFQRKRINRMKIICISMSINRERALAHTIMEANKSQDQQAANWGASDLVLIPV